MRTILLLLLIILLLLAPVSVLLAQEDATPTQERIEDTAAPLQDIPFIDTENPVDEAVNGLLNALWVLLYVPAAAGFVTVLTSVTKRLVKTIPAPQIALTWMLVLWLIYIITRSLGLDSQFQAALQLLTQIGYILLGATGTQLMAASVYDRARQRSIPLVGYSRTKSAFRV